jgi:hypothetical protein
VVTGRCLCGAVSFEVSGPLGAVSVCHCIECRRWHGHVAAMTSVARCDLLVHDERELRWVQSPESDVQARRGFCGACGSSLFYDPPASDRISVAAGTLNAPTGVRIADHWYVCQASDYYRVPDDEGPRYERRPSTR